MTALRALLFDVDGTLADTERDGHRIAFNRAFADAGLDWVWTPELYGELLAVTGGKERMLHYVARCRPDFASRPDLAGLVARLHRAKTAIYVEMLDAGVIPLRPGVERLLRAALEAGYRLAIATTTTPENVTALLRNALAPDAESWFQLVAAGDVVPRKKPAPDIYTWAMDRLGVAPDECVAFEDSRHGLDSATGAGIRAVVVTVNDYTRSQDFHGATLVLDSLGEPDRPAGRLAGVVAFDGCCTLETVRAVHAAACG
ncbi:MAG: HAD family hydrolase [Gammaproteobacteria bacterium]|nr:HAD family hydrolase [Gammaproteobacteria bacterium]